MRRGCIATGKIECDDCHRLLLYGERYLLIDDEEGGKKRLCVDCSTAHGYVSHRIEKVKETITFFPDE